MDRYCKTCGEVLVKRPSEGGWHFNRRVTCAGDTDCARSLGAERKKTGTRGGEHSSPMYSADLIGYTDPRDVVQAKINIALAELDAQRRGLGHSTVKIITGEDAQRMLERGDITHIDNIRTTTLGGFASWRG